MPAINFKARFSDDITTGRKTTTIRANRKDGRKPCKLGDRINLWTGMRTKSARKLATGKCIFLTPIKLQPEYPVVGIPARIVFEDRVASQQDAIAIAKEDGFDRVEDMFAFFQEVHGLPFYGWLIKWELVE